MADTIARDKKQVTGFNLNGYSDILGGTPVGGARRPGDRICAAGWTAIDIAAGDVVVVSSTGGLEVSADGGLTWTALLEAPAPVL